jgi:hypothetical protein
MLRKTKGSVSLRLSKTDYSKLNRLRGPQADTTCVTSVIKRKFFGYRIIPILWKRGKEVAQNEMEKKF